MSNSLRMPELTEEEFVAHMQEEDFCLRYGNPVYIRRKDGGGLICMSYKMYERIQEEIDELRRLDDLSFETDGERFIANFLPDDIRPKNVPKL